MSGGYTGKILFVNLSTGLIEEETLDEKMCRDYIGGYGIGARILYSRQKAGVDPLGEENTLGFHDPYRDSWSHRYQIYRCWEITADQRRETLIPEDILDPI